MPVHALSFGGGCIVKNALNNNCALFKIQQLYIDSVPQEPRQRANIYESTCNAILYLVKWTRTFFERLIFRALFIKIRLS